MSMFGWVVNPAFLTYKPGRQPFRFEVGDVVDTRTTSGSLDYTVWLEVYDQQSDKKLAELQLDLATADLPPAHQSENPDHTLILAIALKKLGFVDSSKHPEDAGPANTDDAGLTNPEESLETPAPIKQSSRMICASRILAPKPAPTPKKPRRRMVRASRILSAVSTGIELDDSYYQRGPAKGPSDNAWDADSQRSHAREEDFKEQKVWTLLKNTFFSLANEIQIHTTPSKTEPLTELLKDKGIGSLYSATTAELVRARNLISRELHNSLSKVDSSTAEAFMRKHRNTADWFLKIWGSK